jgi:hypothetical protein
VTDEQDFATGTANPKGYSFDRALSAMSVLKQSTSCPVHLDDGSSYADLPHIRASDTIDFCNARQCLGAKQAATHPLDASS